MLGIEMNSGQSAKSGGEMRRWEDEYSKLLFEDTDTTLFCFCDR